MDEWKLMVSRCDCERAILAGLVAYQDGMGRVEVNQAEVVHPTAPWCCVEDTGVLRMQLGLEVVKGCGGIASEEHN